MRTADCFVRSLVLQVYGLWENPSFMFLYVHDAQRFLQFCTRGSLVASRRSSVAMRPILHLRTEKRRIWAFFVCQHLAACTGDVKTRHKKNLALLWENVCEFYETYSTGWWSDIFCFQPNLGWLCIVLRLYFNCSFFLQGSGSLSWTSQANGPDSVTARTLAPGLAQLDWLGPLLAGTPPFGQLQRRRWSRVASFFCDCLLTLSTHSTLLYKIFLADHIRNYCLVFGCASSSSSDLKAHDVVGYFHFSQRVTNPFLWPLQPCNSGLKISSTQLLARDASGNGVQAGLLKQIGTQH